VSDLGKWPEANDLLDRALDHPPEERRAFIGREAGHNPDLAEALLDVLAEAEQDDGFLERSGLAMAGLLSEAWEEAHEAEPPALEPGQRFTTYAVLELVGRGGMGEVYRARDERLGRMVALKVLPREFVEDRQRLARFEREARLLASLNHPNIAAIYGLAEDGGRQALVLEYVEGTTLAERIGSGPLPIREVVSVATQIALALQAAHRRGIVHRDLKPANVSLIADGTVKILDFGLAKAVGSSAADITSLHDPGRIVGTPAYMSPEQARGVEVDYRADVWAFGCVLYEMLTGVRAFDRGTTQDTIARVVEREADFSLLPAATPEHVRRVLRRALTKDPAGRLADLGSVMLDLGGTQHEDGKAGPWERRPRWGSTAFGAAAATFILIAGIGGGVLLPRAWRARPPTVVRLAVPVPASDVLIASAQQVASLSPDGRTVVYRASRDGTVQLFKHALDGMESEPIPGTTNAAGPFFSPDGAWLAFDGAGRLQKVSVDGGTPVTICPAPGGATASWGGNTIVFSTATGRMLNQVAASGGTPEPVTLLDVAAGDLAHTFPHVMPGGNAALFTIVRAQERLVAVVRLDTKRVTVLTAGSQPHYLAPGYLLFVRDHTMWAASFDDRRLQITGEAVPVVEALDTAASAAAQFDVAAGSLMYAPRRVEVRERQLVWLNRSGRETPLRFEPRGYTRAALSRDGRRIALAVSERDNTHIWVGDIEHGTMTRLTRDPTSETAPSWTPDGRAVVYRSERDGGGLFLETIDGSSRVRRLTTSGSRLHTPHGWSHDGRTLLFTEFRSYGEQSIYALVPGSPDSPRRLLTGAFAQLRPQISPDGRWMAYQSDESGRFEIYVRPFPDVTTGKSQVSLAGGTSPRWAHRGGELFYYDGQSLVAASVGTGKTFTVLGHARLFAYEPFGGQLGPDFEVSADDQRFLMLRSSTDTPASRLQLVLVQNWIEELRGKLMASGR
jgi:serine/threonine-protein kinase